MAERRLVFLHGLLGAPEPLAPLADELRAAGCAVELPVLPGHGPTPHGVEAATFDGAVDALARALDLARRPAVLGGYSLGGRLALALAARFPATVLDVIAVGAHPGLDPPAAAGAGPERAARLAWEDEQRRVLREQGLPAFVAQWEALPLFASQADLPPAALAAQRRARLGHTPAGLDWALAVLGTGRMPPLLPRLAASRQRPLFVAGERDARFVGLAAAAARAVPGGRAVTVPGAGHNVALEAPRALATLLTERVALT